ncbi:tellurite resistance/C4-dicarboxylate transporter family protein [Nafulsella turpanensis]|uniref:tellurite resistance/C4-dicarboxylate transporter family protein n=1 Tax=Nafulsella turpanensis TaxID=1265690 RepID=UPI00034B5C7C|nr:tellurite resistance/C4-dicarboxylate transporter family protein [Nafulsella turpanensis]
MTIVATLKEEAKSLFPAYFALVMSTGIVSIAAHLLDFPSISNGLFWLNNALYFFLLGMLLSRLLFYFPSFLEDFNSHAKGAGFFTLVAGTCILGTQYVLLKGWFMPAMGLWYFGLILWLVLIYAFFVMIIVKREKPSLEKGINGIWLVIVVATQAVSVLGTLLSEHLPFPTERVIFLTLSGYLLGCMLYIILITLIFYRLAFYPMRAEEFAPPFWINMGAVAISTLSGATLILFINENTGFLDFIPFLKGFSLFFWATGSWWIPIIVILGIWRHIYNHIPLFYHPQYWGMVFPLGMYTVCTWRLAQAFDLDYLKLIPTYFIYLAFTAWVLTFLGLLYNFFRLLSGKKMPA